MNRAQRRALDQKRFRKQEKEVVQDVKREMDRRDYVAYVFAMRVVGEALRRVNGLGPKRLAMIEQMILQVETEYGIERLHRPLDGE